MSPKRHQLQRSGRHRRAGLYGLVAAALMAAIVSTDGWASLEERVEGLLLAQRGPLPWNPQVLVIDLDEPSFRHLGRPVPRATMARLVEAMTAAGVQAIAFDIVYDVPATDGPEADALFTAAVARSSRTVLPLDCYPRWIEPNGTLAPAQVLPPGPTPGPSCESVSLPLAPLRDGAMLAHFVYGPSASGYARYAAPLVSFDGSRLPGLAIAAFASGRGVPLERIVQKPGGLQVADLFIPVDADGLTPVSFRGLPPDGRMPLEALVAGLRPTENRFDDPLADQLKGKYLLIGTSVDSMGDISPLATGEKYPAVAFHAAFLSDLLDGHIVREAPRSLQVLLALCSALLLTGAALMLQLWRGVVALAALGFGAFACAQLASSHGYLVGPMGTLVAGVLAWSATTGARLAIRERQQRVLKDAFGAYVDATVLDRLLVDPDRYLALSGARKTLTVLFTDICGFTALTNQLGAEEIVALLRLYLAEMTRIVTARQGRVDKIMGDGILAVFGDPISFEDHARRALEVCVEMQAALLRVAAQWKLGGAPLAIRLGVATGNVFVGNVGSFESKLEYTVLGIAVNLASRLEGRAPPGCALVSDETYRATSQWFEFASLGTLALKGYASRQPAWLLMGALPQGQLPRRHARLLAPRVPVRLWVGPHSEPAVVTNVSVTGLFVETALEAAPGALLELEFGGRPGRFVARVRRCGKSADGATGLGLEVEPANDGAADPSHVLATLWVDRRRD